MLDKIVLSAYRAALLDDCLFATQSTDRAVQKEIRYFGV